MSDIARGPTQDQKECVDLLAHWLETSLVRQTDANSVEHVGDSNDEIEMRFGIFSADSRTFETSQFCNGVKLEQFQRARKLCCALDPTQQTSPPESALEVVTHYGECNLRKIQCADGTTRHEHKVAVSSCNMAFSIDSVERPPDSLGAFSRDGIVGVRFAHSRETRISETHAEHLVPRFVRLRARTSYYFKMWRIDLTIVQQGLNTELARTAPAVYEIEVELLPERIDWSRHSFHYLAAALLLKVREFGSTHDIGTLSANNPTTLPHLVAQHYKRAAEGNRM